MLAITVLCFFSSNARPAVYWASVNNVPVEQGVRSSIVSVCFVGDTLTSRPDRVQQVLDYIRWFEHSANIQFNYLGTCAGPTMQPNGNDFYDGDIRVVIPGMLFDSNGKDIFFEVINIPGKGCTRESADPKNPGGSCSGPITSGPRTENKSRFRTRFIENRMHCGTTLSDNRPTLIDKGPKTSSWARFN